jgi:hypothetical protein
VVRRDPLDRRRSVGRARVPFDDEFVTQRQPRGELARDALDAAAVRGEIMSNQQDGFSRQMTAMDMLTTDPIGSERLSPSARATRLARSRRTAPGNQRDARRTRASGGSERFRYGLR